MNYTEATQYIYSLFNIERKEYMSDAKHCGVYLTRLQFFLDILGNPEKRIPHYIHVTGTSGKGSVTNMLHSILAQNGWKTASNISPHPTSIEERWRIDDRHMSRDEFVPLVEQTIKPALDQYIRTSPYDMISFFELMTALGLYWFAEQQSEWCILEVGCGGRYDSTNIIPHKDIAVITNIGLDHLGIIGNTIEEIAKEKAGIINTKCPVFSMEKNTAIQNIIQSESRDQKTNCTFVSHTATDISPNKKGMSFVYDEESYTIPVHGIHQIHNAELAITIAKELHIPLKVIQQGLAQTSFELRTQIVSTKPLTILDGAHNTDKMATTVDTVQMIQQQYKHPQQDIHLLLGFSADKHIDDMLTQLAKLQPKTVSCTKNTVNLFKSVVSPQELAKKIQALLPKTTVYMSLDPQDAYKWSIEKQAKHDILLITGSIYLSGELSQYLQR